MHGKLAALAAILVLLLASPATAEWKGWDPIPEPNTADDGHGPMWPGPGGTVTEPRAYLDTFLVQDVGFGLAHATSNVDGGRLMPPAAYRPMALLGFWVDCNHDGFIGHGVTGQTVYPAGLADSETCPAGSAYNDGDHVDEWRAIHRGTGALDPGAVRVHGDTRDVLDPGARAWGDWGYPGEAATPEWAPPGAPFPSGTLTTYHGHFRYVDGATFGALSDTLWRNGIPYDAIPHVLDHQADAYPDDGDRTGTSPLAYARYAWNTSTSGHGGHADCGAADQPACRGAYAQPYATAWDCREPAAADATVGDVDGDGRDERLVLPTPGPNADPWGSLDGTVYQLTRAPIIRSDDDGDPCGPDGEHLPYRNLERHGHDALVVRGKASADFILHPVPEQRVTAPGIVTNAADPASGHCHLGPTCLLAGGYWQSDQVFTHTPPRDGWGVVEPGRLTVYADVTETGLVNAGANASAFPDGNDPHAYGHLQCENGDRLVGPGGWWCDPSGWPDDEPKVGDPYDLRDVDCYDGSANPRAPPLLARC